MTHAILTDQHHEASERDVFGFWIYILTDCILFSCLFATFSVLRHNTYGDVAIGSLVDLPYVFLETVVLLMSSLTCGLAMLALYRNKLASVMSWLIITLILGASFVGLELNEFIHLYQEGHGWQVSAALSSFFTLVGTHGLHVTIGLLVLLVLMGQFSLFGSNDTMKRRLTYFGLFWAFLDIIWIFVFTIVYLMGVI